MGYLYKCLLHLNQAAGGILFSPALPTFAHTVLDLFEEYSPAQVSTLVLCSSLLREYATDRVLAIMKQQLSTRYGVDHGTVTYMGTNSQYGVNHIVVLYVGTNSWYSVDHVAVTYMGTNKWSGLDLVVVLYVGINDCYSVDHVAVTWALTTSMVQTML